MLFPEHSILATSGPLMIVSHCDLITRQASPLSMLSSKVSPVERRTDGSLSSPKATEPEMADPEI